MGPFPEGVFSLLAQGLGGIHCTLVPGALCCLKTTPGLNPLLCLSRPGDRGGSPNHSRPSLQVCDARSEPWAGGH